ncbi:hypothetical protein LCGC14_2415110 [marine sediment metagenome]|uniref:Uncharacterized protein n=1 Tax=marine sediment metagenome TaxID=412755 RepID=A0A0F9E3H9_9ZZZZ
MAITINIKDIPFGNSRIAVRNSGNRDNFASTILTSYANLNPDNPHLQLSRFRPSISYKTELILSGIPLSITTLQDPALNPSIGDTIGDYYALDIIENNESEDDYPNPSAPENIATDPSNKTFSLNGVRLSASRKSGRLFWNIVKTDEAARPKENIIFNGIPLAKGYRNELILNNTGLSLTEIDEYVNIMIGGIPLSAGRINFKYYLVVSPITKP